jgi:hypothetical protein
LLRRYDVTRDRADLKQAVSVRAELVRETADGRPGRVKFLNNLGLALLADDRQNVRRITDVFREACVTGLETNPGEVLTVASTWGAWASGRGSWSEAVTAYDFGVSAVEALFRIQPLRRYKEVWLTTAGKLTAEAAYAAVRLGQPASAALLLERGRGALLSEALDRDRADLRRLGELGHDELRDRYLRAVMTLIRAQA